MLVGFGEGERVEISREGHYRVITKLKFHVKSPLINVNDVRSQVGAHTVYSVVDELVVGESSSFEVASACPTCYTNEKRVARWVNPLHLPLEPCQFSVIFCLTSASTETLNESQWDRDGEKETKRERYRNSFLPHSVSEPPAVFHLSPTPRCASNLILLNPKDLLSLSLSLGPCPKLSRMYVI